MMDAYVTIWTGSRDLKTRAAVWAKLDEVEAAHPNLCIRVGDCDTGLDAFVREWTRERWPTEWHVRCRVYVAHWDLYGDYAGPKRNGEMVKDGAAEAHAWFAPPPALNKGTNGCYLLLVAAGIKVYEYGRESLPVQEALL